MQTFSIISLLYQFQKYYTYFWNWYGKEIYIFTMSLRHKKEWFIASEDILIIVLRLLGFRSLVLYSIISAPFQHNKAILTIVAERDILFGIWSLAAR